MTKKEWRSEISIWSRDIKRIDAEFREVARIGPEYIGPRMLRELAGQLHRAAREVESFVDRHEGVKSSILPNKGERPAGIYYGYDFSQLGYDCSLN